MYIYCCIGCVLFRTVAYMFRQVLSDCMCIFIRMECMYLLMCLAYYSMGTDVMRSSSAATIIATVMVAYGVNLVRLWNAS